MFFEIIIPFSSVHKTQFVIMTGDRRVTSLTKEKLRNSLKENLTEQNLVLNESVISRVTKFIETL
jgi:hypothetical protein